MMRFFGPLYLLTLLNFTISCSSDNAEPQQELDLSNLTLSISDIEHTTANVSYSGRIGGKVKKILYKAKNASSSYQTIDMSTRTEVGLGNLDKATTYELFFEVSDDNSKLQSQEYYFTTKSVDFDYFKFYSDYSWYNDDYYSPYEFFSHLNRNHVIHAPGLDEFDNVQVYLVNEQKTDSLKISSTVASDDLSFTIPSDYLSQNPRESFKKAYVGVKVKDSYQYIINYWAASNLLLNPNFNGKNTELKLKIFNDSPYIDMINISQGSSANCPNHTQITLLGEFLGYWSDYYWTPVQADLVIFDSEGSIYETYSDYYGISSGNCHELSVSLSGNGNDLERDGLLNYHQRVVSLIKLIDMPSGNYSAKIIFTLKNEQFIETNTVAFIVE